jgi:ribonucleoside-diphosphate reductase alpha chain
LEREGKYVRQRQALDVWRRILTNLFETGHPWVTFKDPCNLRSPQKHIGPVHSSNLCTEITLPTDDTETAVCNLASVNLAKHVRDGKMDWAKLERTITTLMRMLDNVIDINYYPSDRAAKSNARHRPVGLGMMGETEAKIACGVAFDSDEGVQFSDEVMERISYYAIKASAHLARERGSYMTFEGSDWSKGVLPIDTAVDKTNTMGGDAWNELREIVRGGMRNSNTMAIAPTATISVIAGTTPCNEPIFELSRIEENMSGHFLVVDPCVKYRRPDLLRTVWEMDQMWLVKTSAARQKWLDQSQSTSFFVGADTTGPQLDKLYRAAHKAGLKTTYYLRSRTKTKQAGDTPIAHSSIAQPFMKFTAVDNGPSCEACQ